MRKMHNHGQMAMVGAAIGLFITLIISILVFYNIAATMDSTTLNNLDSKYNTGVVGWAGTNGSTPARNATNSILNQGATFFTIAPIVGIVIVAVVVIGYVQRIGG